MTTTSASSLLLQTPKNRSAAGANRWYHVLIDCISALNFFSESPITTIPGTHFQIIHQHTRLHLFQSSNSFRQSNCKISAPFNKCKLQNMCLQWELCDFLYAQLIINHTNLTRYWKPSSEILFHFERITWHSTDMSAAHPWFDSPVPTHPEGVLSDYGGSGGHLTTVNALSCWRNQFEIIWVLWHGVLSFWKKLSEDRYTVLLN